MTTHKEALTLAREALVRADRISGYPNNKQTITAIDEALAQPEQEPVAWLDGPHLVMREDWRNRSNYKGPYVGAGRAIPDSWVPALYTTPPQRTWVGLTDSEKYALSNDVVQRGVPVFEAICEAEAKLKEKNT